MMRKYKVLKQCAHTGKVGDIVTLNDVILERELLAQEAICKLKIDEPKTRKNKTK